MSIIDNFREKENLKKIVFELRDTLTKLDAFIKDEQSKTCYDPNKIVNVCVQKYFDIRSLMKLYNQNAYTNAKYTKELNIVVDEMRNASFVLESFVSEHNTIFKGIINALVLIPRRDEDDMCEEDEDVEKQPAPNIGGMISDLVYSYLLGRSERVSESDLRNRTEYWVRVINDVSSRVPFNNVCVLHPENSFNVLASNSTDVMYVFSYYLMDYIHALRKLIILNGNEYYAIKTNKDITKLNYESFMFKNNCEEEDITTVKIDIGNISELRNQTMEIIKGKQNKGDDCNGDKQ